MGRFYKATTFNPEEVKFNLPEEQMGKVLDFTDTAITTNNQTRDQLTNAINETYKQFLEFDQAKAKEYLEKYRPYIDEVASNMNADPMNWRNSLQQLNSVKKDFTTDYASGNLSKFAANAQAWRDFQKAEEELNKKDPTRRQYSEQYAQDYYNKLKNTTTYGDDGKWYTFTGKQHHMTDANALFQDYFKKYVSDMESTGYAYSDGKFIHKGTGKVEFLDKQKMMNGFNTYLAANPDLMREFQHRQQVGNISGFMDENGKILDPTISYEYLDSKGNKRVGYNWNSNSFLGNLGMSASNPYQFRKELENKKDIEVDKFAIDAKNHTYNMIENAQKAQLDMQKEAHKQGLENQYKLEAEARAAKESGNTIIDENGNGMKLGYNAYNDLAIKTQEDNINKGNATIETLQSALNSAKTNEEKQRINSELNTAIKDNELLKASLGNSFKTLLKGQEDPAIKKFLNDNSGLADYDLYRKYLNDKNNERSTWQKLKDVSKNTISAKATGSLASTLPHNIATIFNNLVNFDTKDENTSQAITEALKSNKGNVILSPSLQNSKMKVELQKLYPESIKKTGINIDENTKFEALNSGKILITGFDKDGEEVKAQIDDNLGYVPNFILNSAKDNLLPHELEALDEIKNISRSKIIDVAENLPLNSTYEFPTNYTVEPLPIKKTIDGKYQHTDKKGVTTTYNDFKDVYDQILYKK